MQTSQTIAVLPFVNLSPDPQDDFFGDGLTEELIDRLSQLRELEVIARTSVMSFKNKQKKPSEIGRELRAGALIEGSILKAGTKIQVSAKLIDSNTEHCIWSSVFDEDLKDLFVVQSKIAQQVADMLKLKLSPAQRHALERRATANIEAYILYLRGRSLFSERGKGIQKAIQFFTEATHIDPTYARRMRSLPTPL